MKQLYFIALLPPADLREEIHEIRMECSGKFGVYKALRPPVHITLYPPFRFEESYEKKLVQVIRQRTRDLASFPQVIENFGHFRKEVVFIKALTSPGLIKLQQTITGVFQTKGPDRFQSSEYHPHLTVAYRDVSPEKFKQIWAEYKDRQFSASFRAEGFSLLKHDKTSWNIIADFSLTATARKDN